jgi:hypothetical protein
VLAACAFVLILRWRSEPRTSTLPGERFLGAMRAGINYAMQSPRLRVVMLRIFLFFLQATALMALLPLVARQLHGGGPATFTLMLSCVGVGAIVAALRFPRWRARFTRDQFVLIGTLVHAALSALIVLVPEVWVAVPAMVVHGHGLDLGGQFADRRRPAGHARLGARTRHVDLPDGADGRLGRRLAAVGAGGQPGQRAHGRAGGVGVRAAVALLADAASVNWTAELDFTPASGSVRARAGVRGRARGRAGDGDAGIPDRPRARGRLSPR